MTVTGGSPESHLGRSPGSCGGGSSLGGGPGLDGLTGWAPGHLACVSTLFLESVRPGEGAFPRNWTFLSQQSLSRTGQRWEGRTAQVTF